VRTRASILRYHFSVVPLVSALAGTHCAYPHRDGQAELTWVAGYIRWWLGLPVYRVPTVTRPRTNRVRLNATV